jgi:hydrogenase maturation protease
VKLVMFTWGNPSRGDDGVGPWFADRYRDSVHDQFELVEDFQLQVEHLLDCREGDLLLFVDARCDDGDGYRLEEIGPSTRVAHTSHALTPRELLGHYLRVFDSPPPPAFQLTVPGFAFDLGQPMSAETAASCAAAAQLVNHLLARVDPAAWRDCLVFEGQTTFS